MIDKVMLVDDEATFLRVLASALTAGGYEVAPFSSSSEALVAAADDPPVVAVVSLELRDGSAENFLRSLAIASPQTECVLLADPSSLDRLVNLYDLGTLYNHRWKPLEEIGDLARDVARAIERRALKRQNSYLLTELRDTRDELRGQAEFMVQVEKLAALGRLFAAASRGGAAALGEIAQVVSGTGLTGASGDRRICGAPPCDMDELRHIIVRCSAVVSGLACLGEDSQDDWQAVDINEVLSDALALTGFLMDSCGVQTITHFTSGPATTSGCRSELLQASVHIVLNAIDAMPDGGTLCLTSEVAPGANPGVRFSIRDDGTGIEARTLPRIFDPFFTTGPFGKRTGLGLSTTRSIVRRHDGEISIQTAVGRGTTVTVWLPTAVATGLDGAGSSYEPLLRAA